MASVFSPMIFPKRRARTLGTFWNRTTLLQQEKPASLGLEKFKKFLHL